MNRDIIEDNSKEKAIKLSGLLAEEAELRVSQTTELAILDELRMIYYQSNQEDLKRVVEKRITDLGGVY